MSPEYRHVGVKVPEKAGALSLQAARLLTRTIEERSGARVDSAAGFGVSLAVEPGIGSEGFRVADGGKDGVRIVGNDERGLLYGVGRFLRDSEYKPAGFVPGSWRGTSVPEKPLRGMYLATHFFNFYHAARLERVERYIEEMALWGINALHVWFDLHHYDGIKTPEAQAMLDRLAALLRTARTVGMDTGLGVLANEGYRNSPVDMRADPNTGRAHYKVELCPSKPGARELMLKWMDEEFSEFERRGVPVDNLWIWPYDQGGCACEKCRPWGANGFLVMAEGIGRLARKRFPRVRNILSTWLFDYRKDEGEWSGLGRALAAKPDWLDYILADSHTDFPKYLLEHEVPGGLPLINFPEISMWGMCPWGGIGANPLPDRFQRLWNQGKDRLSGGFPYSEGLFEDLNKAISSQFYWRADRPVEDIVREYVSFEFGPQVVGEVTEAIFILEKNHHHAVYMKMFTDTPMKRVDGAEDAGSLRAFSLLEEADAKLAPGARASWRWRILYLRALVDRERFANGMLLTPACEEALEELTEIYEADRAISSLSPPTRGAMGRLKNTKDGV